MGPLFITDQRRKDSLEEQESVKPTAKQDESGALPTEDHRITGGFCKMGRNNKKPVHQQWCNDERGECQQTNLRKYVVLLQDCVAIKFVSAGQHHHSHQFPFAFDCTNQSSNHLGNIPPFGSHQHNQNNGASSNVASGMSTSAAEVDHSLHGLYLYKAFREANLKCYWNTAMCEAIRSLEYKGYIVPSTILVFSNCRFLNVLRTAWSRRILRHPPGYRLELIGEVEEIVAQPVQQGQFAPLSDSLCWAILELSSTGQEAFVDSIISALLTAFPTMSQPPKELVYQTLEKLIREQKIYQTSHGYYIVTPDVSTFMNSRSATPACINNPFYSANSPLDALVANYCELDKISLSQHSWGSAASVLDSQELLFKRSKQPLKRHHSLKIIRQRDRDLDIPRPHMGARSLSFRLSKVNSLFDSDKEDDDEPVMNKSETGRKTVNESVQTADNPLIAQEQAETKTTKKRRSFFRRWFSFRRLRSKSRGEVKPLQLEELTKSPKLYDSRRSSNTISTQTISRSIESLNNDNEIHDDKSKWNSFPSTRACRKSILDECSPFYDTVVDQQRRVSGGDFSRYSGSRSSGYGSQQGTQEGNKMHNNKEIVEEMHRLTRRRHFSGTTIRTASPSSSVSAIYASIANNRESPEKYYYRNFDFMRPTKYHRNNGNNNRQKQQQRPKSAYELFVTPTLKQENPSKIRKKSMESLASHPQQVVSVTQQSSSSSTTTTTTVGEMSINASPPDKPHQSRIGQDGSQVVQATNSCDGSSDVSQ